MWKISTILLAHTSTIFIMRRKRNANPWFSRCDGIWFSHCHILLLLFFLAFRKVAVFIMTINWIHIIDEHKNVSIENIDTHAKSVRLSVSMHSSVNCLVTTICKSILYYNNTFSQRKVYQINCNSFVSIIFRC